MSCIGSGAHIVLPTPAGYRGEAIRQKLGRERQLAIRAVRERWLER